MRIGLIGPGKLGVPLAELWRRAGHEVMYSFSRSREKLERLAAPLNGDSPSGSGSWGTPEDAAAFGDVVMMSIHREQLEDAIESTKGALGGKTLLESVNSFQPDGTLAVGHSSSVAEEIAAMTGGAAVVPVFNNIPSSLMQLMAEAVGAGRSPTEVFGGRRAAVFYCGDSAEAKVAAATLIAEVGFEPVDAGGLISARLIEPFAYLTVQAGRHLKIRNIGVEVLRPRRSDHPRES